MKQFSKCIASVDNLSKLCPFLIRVDPLCAELCKRNDFLCSAFFYWPERKFGTAILTTFQLSWYRMTLFLFLNLMMQIWQHKMRLPWKAFQFYSFLTSKGSSWGSRASTWWLFFFFFPDIIGEIPPVWLWTCRALNASGLPHLHQQYHSNMKPRPLVLWTR